jgi:cation transport ATPase
MTEAKIQVPVDRGVLRPKAEVEWRAIAGEEFPSEDVKEHVVFASFFERG